MSTDALRAAFRLYQMFAGSVRTHYAPAPPERRGHNGTHAQSMARARNGRKAGPTARRRRRTK